MTALDLTPIKERLEKAGQAAPLPWKHSPWHIEEAPEAVRCADGWIVANTSDSHTAILIASAPTDIATLVEEVERLRGALGRAETFIAGLGDDLHHRRVTDWYPEAANNAAVSMSEDMRLLGNACADFDAGTPA